MNIRQLSGRQLQYRWGPMKPQAGKRWLPIALLLVPVAVFGGLFAFGRSQKPKPRMPLIDAARASDFENVESNVLAGSPVNTLSTSGHTALYAACSNADEKTVDYLLAHGASPNAEQTGKDTPINVGAMTGNLHIVQALIDKGADLHAVSRDGQTPLHAAATGGNTQIISLLVNKGLDPNARRKVDHATPICDAASAGKWDAIDYLRTHGGDLNITGYNGRTPLSLTILRRHRDISRQLIDVGADVNIRDADNVGPIQYSMVVGDFDLTRKLIPMTKKIGSYDKAGRNELYCAVAFAAPTDVIQLLIKAGCPVEQKNAGPSPMSIAVGNDDKELIAILKAAQANENKR